VVPEQIPPTGQVAHAPLQLVCPRGQQIPLLLV
jgi:hypothetical protein